MPHGFPHTQTAVADQTVVRMGDLMLDMPEDTTPQETSALSSFFMSMLEPAPGFNPIQDIIQSPTPVREAIRKAPFLPMVAAMAIGGGSGKQKLAKVGTRRATSKKTVSELIETIKENERVLVRGEAPALGGKMDYSTLGGNKVRSQYDLPHESGSSISVISDLGGDVTSGFGHQISVTRPQGSASVDFYKHGNEISIGTLESWASHQPGALRDYHLLGETLKSSRRHNIQRQSAVNELLGTIAEYTNKGDVIHPGSLTSDSFAMLTKGLSKGPLKKKFKLVTAEDLKAMVEKGSLPEGWTAERAREMIETSGGLGKISTGGESGFIDAFGTIGRKKRELASLMDEIFVQGQFTSSRKALQKTTGELGTLPVTTVRGSLNELLSKIEELNVATQGVAKSTSRKLNVNVGEDFEDSFAIAKTGIKELQDMFWKVSKDLHGKGGAKKMGLEEETAIWDYLSSKPGPMRFEDWSTMGRTSQFTDPSVNPVTAQAKYMVRRLLDSQNTFDYKPFALIKK